MKEIEFNLLDEPWIRVLDAQNQLREVSLYDLLLHAHEYSTLSGELPTQDAAILRLALAVLHTVFSRTDETGEGDPPEEAEDAITLWKRIWDAGKLPQKPLADYFAKWHERFWLFHPERPFYQMTNMEYGTDYGASKLNGALSESSNKLRLFPEYSGSEKTHLTYAQAARWLLYVHAYDDTSAKQANESKKIHGKLPSAGAGWLGQLGLVWIIGDNVFETLMYNLVLVNGEDLSEHELPVWELPAEPRTERHEIAPPDNLSALYTLQSRRILMQREDSRVIGYRLLGGEFFDKESVAYAEPMTVWRPTEEGRYKPRRHNESVQMWRDFSVYFSQTVPDHGKSRAGAKAEQKNQIPGVILWNHRLMDEHCLPRSAMINVQIASVQYGDKDFFVKHVFSDQLRLHLSLLSELGAAWRTYIQEEIERCGKAAVYLSLLARDLFLASGGDPEGSAACMENAKAKLFFAFDIPFRCWLGSIDAESNHVELQRTWRKEARAITEHLADEMINQAGEPAIIGRTVTVKEKKEHYAAPKSWSIFRASIRKLYQTGGEQA